MLLSELIDPENDQSWKDRIVESCGSDVLIKAFQTSSLVDNGPVAGGFGAYYGMLFSAKFVSKPYPRFYSKTWPIYSLSWLWRLLITAVLCLPFLLMVLFVGHDSFGDSESSRYGVFFIKRLFPSFCAAFVIFGLIDYICLKWIKVYKYDDSDHR